MGLLLAHVNAVIPSSSLTLISAFLSSMSYFTTEMWPFMAAKCNGLLPLLVRASTSAP